MADALASGASNRKVVQVQVLLSAPNKNKTNPDNEFVLFFAKCYFGIVVKYN